MRICLFGAASDRVDQTYKDAVEKLGAEMAKRGHTLVFGSGACGMMGAAARGVRANNGEIIGVIPRFFIEQGVEEIFLDNTKTIYTDTMNERKQTMEDLADAYMIVPGGIGTFDEFFEVLTNKQLGIEDKPIAVYNLLHFFDELDAVIKSAIAKKFINENCGLLYKISDDIGELFEYIENDTALGMSVHELKDG